MPAKTKHIVWPKWVESIDDGCLAETVREALVARDFAVRQGAEQHRVCRAAFTSAESTLEQVEFGRVTGSAACRKAATAVRKYNTAGECSKPTAKLGRRH